MGKRWSSAAKREGIRVGKTRCYGVPLETYTLSQVDKNISANLESSGYGRNMETVTDSGAVMQLWSRDERFLIMTLEESESFVLVFATSAKAK